MLSGGSKNIYTYINYKKVILKMKKINIKKLNLTRKYCKKNDYLKIINTCILMGKRKSVLNKNKIGRHFVRNPNKKLFNYWLIKSWLMSKKKFFKIKIKKKSFKNKISFNGRIYKLSIKKNIWNWRFNKFNKNIMVLNKIINISFHKWRTKMYIHNNLNKLERLENLIIFKKIRLANVYTLRGLQTDYKTIDKKQGRISGYF